jgi:hypothetical protein
LQNDVTYYVWIRAANTGGVSEYSLPESGKPERSVSAPAAPREPDVIGGHKKLTLTWTAVSGASGYVLYYGTINDPNSATEWDNHVPAAAGEIIGLITGLTNETLYYVWVKAKNAIGLSGESPVGSGTPKPKPALDLTNNLFQIGVASADFIFSEDGNGDRLTRKKETALGNLVAEGTEWYIKEHYPEEEIDFVLLYGALITGGIPKGPITIGTMKGILSYTDYGDPLYAFVSLPGDKIIQLFEYVASVYHDGGGGHATGAWGMPSSEVRYTIDYTNDPEHKTGELKNLTIHGKPVDTGKTYRFVTTNLVLKDGYLDYYVLEAFGQNIRLTTDKYAWGPIEYIYNQDTPIVPYLDGRVTLIGGVVK